jgi:hypothetical protein
VYGLSKDIDLSFLIGRELRQVAIGLYQIIFGFDEEVRISVESEFKFFDGQRESIWKPRVGAPQIAAQTLCLLGDRVDRYEARADGTLSLAFTNGCRLTVLDSSKEFQSYDITRPGQTIVV